MEFLITSGAMEPCFYYPENQTTLRAHVSFAVADASAHLLHSDRFPWVLVFDGPVKTVFQIWGGFDSMTDREAPSVQMLKNHVTHFTSLIGCRSVS